MSCCLGKISKLSLMPQSVQKCFNSFPTSSRWTARAAVGANKHIILDHKRNVGSESLSSLFLGGHARLIGCALLLMFGDREVNLRGYWVVHHPLSWSPKDPQEARLCRVLYSIVAIKVMSLIYTTPSDTNNPQQRRNSVYLGGQVEAKSLSTLQRWGIKYILNVTPEKEAGITVRINVWKHLSPLFNDKTQISWTRIFFFIFGLDLGGLL
jgi:hypothetical protein